MTISGTGFRSPATVGVGTGISVSEVVVGNSNEILATFTVAADATGGNYAVTVRANNQDSDNSVNFYVQIPTKLRFIDTPPRAPNGIGPVITVTDGDVLDTAGNIQRPHQCGVYRNMAYELVDQQNPAQPITEAFQITETFDNYAGVDTVSSPLTMSISAGNIVGDTQYMGRTAPTCLGSDDHESFKQHFKVTMNGHDYNLTTVVSISKGRFSGTYKCDVSITTP